MTDVSLKADVLSSEENEWSHSCGGDDGLLSTGYPGRD